MYYITKWHPERIALAKHALELEHRLIKKTNFAHENDFRKRRSTE